MSDKNLNQLLDALTEAAEKSTQGPWYNSEWTESLCVVKTEDGTGVAVINRGVHYRGDCRIDGRYIALANPENILRLIKEIRKRDRAIEVMSNGPWYVQYYQNGKQTLDENAIRAPWLDEPEEM